MLIDADVLVPRPPISLDAITTPLFFQFPLELQQPTVPKAHMPLDKMIKVRAIQTLCIHFYHSQNCCHSLYLTSSPVPFRARQSSDLSKSDASEEDKIRTMMAQSAQEYDSSKFVRTRHSGQGPLPPSYTCRRCGQAGHYIKQCPMNQGDPSVKRSTGIPRSFMMPASADQRGALMTPSGEYVVPIIDQYVCLFFYKLIFFIDTKGYWY